MKNFFAVFIIFILGVYTNAGFALGQGSVAAGSLVDSEKMNEEVENLNQQIQNQKNYLEEIRDKQEKYASAIKEKQGEKATLNNQMAILDNRLAKAELDIEMTQTEIDRTNLEIKKTEIEIASKEDGIDKEKKHIENILQLIHRQDMVSNLEILLNNDSLSDFLSQEKYLEDINKEIGVSLDSLKEAKKKLESEKKTLDSRNKELASLSDELTAKKSELEGQKEQKIFILGQVKNSEREYQSLLAKAKAEQETAAAEIASMEKIVRAKIAQMEGNKLEFNDGGLIWPVSKNIITTYFHDPEYPFRYIFEHPAVDIRAAQGTTLKAAASGYVAKAKNAGLGYSYIMIIHGDEISTVYGHISRIYVKEDDYVVQGQTIGLTGGTPGTSGAGNLTTGPHLHFEVRKNGLPVDPLQYLP